MITSYSEIFKAWLFARTPFPDIPVGQIVDFVINPDSGKFDAIWIKGMEGLRLISPKDVISWEPGSITIEDENELLKVEDFPQIKNTLKKEVAILSSPVYIQTSKKYLGRVIDFSFDTVSPQILGITVKSGFLWFGHTRKITHKKIFCSCYK